MKKQRPFTIAIALALILTFGAVSNVHDASAIANINVVLSPTVQDLDNTLNQFGYYSVLIQSIGGFVGTVTLNASIISGPSTTANPSLSFPKGSVVNVPLDGQTFTYLMVTVGGGVATGDYTIRVRAQAPTGIYSDGTAQLRVIQYKAENKDFRLSSTPGNVIDVVPGGSGALQINVQSFTTDPNKYPVALLLAPSIPSLITYSFDPPIVNVLGYTTNTSLLLMTSTALTQAGNYTFVISGSTAGGALIHTWAITLRVNGFYIAPSPMAKSVIRGKSTTFTIGVQSVGTFSSTVTLTTIGVPTGMTATLNPAAVLPPQGGLASSILTITTSDSLAEGTYYITVRGQSGMLQSQESIAISVGDFTISATPTLKTAEQNSTAIFTVTGSSSDDYSAIMTLNVQGLPAGVTGTFNPSSLLIPPAGSNSSTLTLTISSTAPVGTHMLNISGTSGTQTHWVNVTLIIVASTDFTLTLNPGSVTVRNGSSASATINVNSINSFSSPVTLTVALPSGSGATGSISPASVTPPPNGIGTATLTITAAASAPAGSGTMTITGTSGTKTKVIVATLTISSRGGAACVIATAAYGSELAPEVYFLRLFRDQSVQSTFAGNQFMKVFNAWYYSFSPTVAEHVKNNLMLRNIVKAVIYPLIGSLYLAQWTYTTLSFAPELAVVAAGLVASSLIGAIYFTPAALLALEIARRKRLAFRLPTKILALAWLTSAALILVAELSSISVLMMAATAAFVLSTITVAAKTVATQTLRILH
ncbi:MAG: CFI-box-CTERM domain-containing protein [Candidatus Bathyarchaeia archaeon]